MKKFFLGLAAAAVVLIVFAFSFGSGQPQTENQSLGGMIHTVLETFGGGLKVGGSGTSITQVLKGTCNLTNPAATVTATTTGAFDCAVTGVKPYDQVFVTMSTTTVSSAVGGWYFRWAGASSTAGYITLGLFNSTGANATPTAATLNGVQYLILR